MKRKPLFFLTAPRQSKAQYNKSTSYCGACGKEVSNASFFASGSKHLNGTCKKKKGDTE